MILDLANWDVDNALRFRWTYSWKELLSFYHRRQKIYADRKKIDFDFLVELASACMGGGSKEEGELSVDNGEGLDEMTEEQEAALRAALGQDFEKLYGPSE